MIGKAADPIIKRSIGRKQTKIVYSKDGSDKRVKTLLTPEADAEKACFTDEGEFLSSFPHSFIGLITLKALFLV